MTTAAAPSAGETPVEALAEAQRMRFAASSSRVVAWAAAAVLVLIVVLWLVYPQHTQLLAVAVAIAPISIAGGLHLPLQRQGRQRAAVYLFFASLVLCVIAVQFFLPAVLPGVAVGFVLIVLLGYLILGDRPGRFLTGLCALFLAVGSVLPNIWDPGWFPPLRGQAPWVLAATTTVAVLIGCGLVLRTVVLAQEGSFLQSQRAQREVERRAAAEQEQRQYLQSAVERYVAFMARVGQGDLSARLTLPASDQDGADPLLLLGRNLNETVAGLQQMTVRVRDTSAELARACAEILAATAQQVRAAGEQSVATSQASATMEEIRTIADETARRAQSVVEIAGQAADVSSAGQMAVTQAVEAMGRIKERVESIATSVLVLSDEAQTIGGIINSVTEIASQSNLLALNAAVEAARAGEAGKGFAVVASEVRSLAEQSRGATVQVKEILSQIQRGVNNSVMATEEGMKRVDDGVRLAAGAGEAIRHQSETVGAATHAAQQIAAAAGQQLAGVQQIAQAVQSIDQATQQTLAGARQAEQAAENLSAMANRLGELVAEYRL